MAAAVKRSPGNPMATCVAALRAAQAGTGLCRPRRRTVAPRDWLNLGAGVHRCEWFGLAGLPSLPTGLGYRGLGCTPAHSDKMHLLRRLLPTRPTRSMSMTVGAIRSLRVLAFALGIATHTSNYTSPCGATAPTPQRPRRATGRPRHRRGQGAGMWNLGPPQRATDIPLALVTLPVEFRQLRWAGCTRGPLAEGRPLRRQEVAGALEHHVDRHEIE